ncbi:C25 family cysteine peptidase, partial [Pontiellaceae bacterium B12219]|nr:C25 family cysteine peptidase [Pontiellaceae bacterium B12219]
MKNNFLGRILLWVGVIGVALSYSAKAETSFLSFPMDTDPGWSTQGDWEFGVPLGNANDPTSGYTGTNVYGYNLAGASGQFTAPHNLKTTALDCSDWVNVKLKFQRWLTVNGSPYPMAIVEASNDGVHWESPWYYFSTEPLIDTEWQEMVYDISEIADRQPTVYIRWGMGSHTESVYGTITNGGWNIDDVELLGNLGDPLEVVPSIGWDAAAVEGNLPTPSQVDYTISNLDDSINLEWAAYSTEPWLSLSQTNGTLLPATGTNITATIDSIGMGPGNYSASIFIENQNSTNQEVRTVNLEISEAPGEIDISPVTGFSVTNLIGQQQFRTLVISNQAAFGQVEFDIELQQTGYAPPAEETVAMPMAMAAFKSAVSEDIEENYSFPLPTITSTEEYDAVNMSGLESYHRVGLPVVPVKPVSISIPDGMSLGSVRVEVLEETELDGEYMLPPAQDLRRNQDSSAAVETPPDPAVYELDQNWPGKIVEENGVYDRRGEQFVNINLFPLQFNPVSGKVTVAQRVQLIIELESETSSKITTFSARTFEVAAASTSSSLPAGGPFKHIIITSEAMAAAPSPWNFQALRDKRIAEGLSSTIVTTEWIYSNYDGTRPDGGSDNPTKIRNFLMDAYENWGTEYALLGGGIDVVPARFFRVDHLRGNDEPVDPIDDFPVDLYYGCLSPSACTFDSNTNGVYGELNDGIAGADVDLVAEVFIGRAPIETIDELSHFVRKTITYAESQDPYLLKVSMVGEKLHSNPDLYGSDMLEQVRLGGSFDGQVTTSFGNHTRTDIPELTFTNLYDVEFDWTTNDFANLVNGEGVHILNALGHSNEHEAFRKTKPYNLSNFMRNTNAFFHYSQSCEVGAFDKNDCIVEEMVAMEHGAFAAVANVRYGWGAEGAANISPYCPSNRFNREFWNSMFEKGIMELGKINQDAKEQLLWDVTGDNPGSAMRWTYLELTLFGDPAQRLHFPYEPEWLSADPLSGSGILSSNAVDVGVIFDATDITSGSYTGEIKVISNDANDPQQIVPVVMIVLEDELSVIPEWGYEFSGEEGALSLPYTMNYSLTNSGPASMDWVATNSAAWLDITPATGTLSPYTQTNLTLTINSSANTLPYGGYDSLVTFSNASSGAVYTRSIQMTISESTSTNDITPPSCIIVRDDVSPTAASNVNFSVLFSEEVSGFEQSDVSLAGSAPGKSISGFSGSGTNYTVVVSEIAGSGTVELRVDAGRYADLAGNTNVAGSSVSYSIDHDEPTVTSITSASTNGVYSAGQEIDITVNFSEPVTLEGGNLVITLDTGGTGREVLISTIANTNVASGVFVLEGGDESADLSVVSITLDGATLYDAVGNSADLSIPSGQNLDDNFDLIIQKAIYTINASVIGAGSISPAGAVSAEHGGTTNFVIQADEGYYIASITIDGNHIEGSPYAGTEFFNTNLIWDGITAGGTITATFASIALNEHTFEVISAHGLAEPEVGIYTNSYGTALSNSVDSIETLGSTQ